VQAARRPDPEAPPRGRSVGWDPDRLPPRRRRPGQGVESVGTIVPGRALPFPDKGSEAERRSGIQRNKTLRSSAL